MIMAASGFAQTTPKIAALYDRLVSPSETNAAAPEILELAKNDSTAQHFLAGKLPSLIVDQLPASDARTTNPVWANAVRLSGQLEIVEAVPALRQALARQPIRGGYDAKGIVDITLGMEGHLDFDIVGRALADIGDPSVPVVADILSKGAFPERRRATWILININSPAAQKAMRDHFPSETDPEVRRLIQMVLHISD
jgi:hypothetical protein